MIDTFNDSRRLLFGIAYRMLGRVVEAEDMVQETWLRWQGQNLPDVQSPKAWLVATITRLCIDQLRSSRNEREEYYGVWLPEPLVESSASPRENAAMADSLTMGFMLMLENLSPIERAVFLLRTVFDYEYADRGDREQERGELPPDRQPRKKSTRAADCPSGGAESPRGGGHAAVPRGALERQSAGTLGGADR